MPLKEDITNNLKNIIGWKTRRKLVIFSVDDYGNVKLDSKEALQKMELEGLKALSRYDRLDSLEDKDDLLQLYDTLSSVKDKNGNHAIFTAFSMCANIDFERMAENGYTQYHYELLPETFSKRKEYEGVWDLWKEGMDKGLLVPQFHGREHLNLKIFEKALENRDEKTLTGLRNKSYIGISPKVVPSYTAAFDFVTMEDNDFFKEVIKDGLNKFEEIFGYRATHFNSPGGREHNSIHTALKEGGIKFIDTSLIKKERQGDDKTTTSFNYNGKKNSLGQHYIVRNVIFEPGDLKKKYDWAEYSFKQVEAAFRWNKPAIISSHRVNFCGHIDPENRKNGLASLRSLLKKIVTKYPEVEFISANELGELIASGKK